MYSSRALRTSADPPATGRAFWRRFKKRVPIGLTYKSGGTATATIDTSAASTASILFADFNTANITMVRYCSFKAWGPVTRTRSFSIALRAENEQGTYFYRQDAPGQNHRAHVGGTVPAVQQYLPQTFVLEMTEELQSTGGATFYICEVEVSGFVFIISPAPVPAPPAKEEDCGFIQSRTAREIHGNLARWNADVVMDSEDGDSSTIASPSIDAECTE